MAKKKKENQLMRDAKDSVALGLTSMVGLNVTSIIGKNVPGSAPIQGNVATSLNLVNVGQTAKVGMNLSKMLGK